MSSKNLFDLLQDDEDVEKTGKTNTKANTALNTGATTTTTKKTTEKKSDNKEKSPRIGGQNKPQRKITNSTNGEVVSEEGRSSTKRDSKTHGRTPRTDASGNIRNRQFDRKSGTGRPHNENKKGGAGQNNWGKEGSVEEAAAPANTTEEKPTEEATIAVPAVEDKTITLAEHFKQLQSQSVAQDAPKIRVAGEGESTAQWDDFEPLVKVSPVNKKDNKSTKEEKKTKKNFIQVELKSGSSKPQNRRGPNKKAQAPEVDEKSFPALSKA
ncbi:hypothetical protein DICPUDRAFT_75726 [Dictyostelium purpureum]|uniref:Hyaluronan/mRNA-binding protein domain-containing protein n=1 Tax=Dictyostelium purpureum TaxID=5786 RepID=F0ZBH8_DICPU|nr:uncharacterized protein DICPUDRAFT_75726 [Dictyostelium purpureum]EGC38697.1 hypothetical protein DICPUDRAFT_75726 [Dictyostelium purpureum]|eukprot:XP_003284793.1 hypothetical protein DICPUDRAFT_75726 [Dictyostelium purpureum]